MRSLPLLAHSVIRVGLKYQMVVLKVRNFVGLKFVELKMVLLVLVEEDIKKRRKNMTAEQIKALPIARKDYGLSATVI